MDPTVSVRAIDGKLGTMSDSNVGVGAVNGWTESGWEGVRDAFVANFTAGREIGAAFSAFHRGTKVVDLWGGVADPTDGRPWDEDTLVLVFSTTKGLTAMCAHHLAETGALDLEAPVVRYWPEFGAAGKEQVTVAHLLSHQSGLWDIDGRMSLADALAWTPVTEALAAQAPHWEPGTRHGYHATTYGWLVGEVVRRVSGRSLGTYFQDEIVQPLGGSAWIGLPESEEPRVARLQTFEETIAARATPGGGGDSSGMRELLQQFMGPNTTLGRSLAAPGGAFSAANVWRERAVRAAEVPAANAVTDARTVAQLYAACIGEVDGVRTLSPAALDRAITQRTSGPNTVLMDLDIQFGLGFMVRSSIMPLGGMRSFGHFGAGGSMGWADPDAELAMGYVMNKMDMGLAGDPRSSNLVDACYASL
jgi:CubicO group peptidase (beta-lactamase class C family)